MGRSRNWQLWQCISFPRSQPIEEHKYGGDDPPQPHANGDHCRNRDRDATFALHSGVTYVVDMWLMDGTTAILVLASIGMYCCSMTTCMCLGGTKEAVPICRTTRYRPGHKWIRDDWVVTWASTIPHNTFTNEI